MSDDDLTITRFAQRFWLEAAAALVAIIRDESASPNARASAAEKILLYSDGRPGASRPTVVEDLQGMSDAARMTLLKALVSHYAPDEFKLLIQSAVDAALEQLPIPAAPKMIRTKLPPVIPVIPRERQIELEAISPDVTNVVALNPPNSNGNTVSPDIDYQIRLRDFQKDPIPPNSYVGASGVVYQSDHFNRADASVAQLKARQDQICRS
jgi:hypothetical protein